MTKDEARHLADVLSAECCIEGMRGPSGSWRASKDDDRLLEKITNLILKTVNSQEVAS